VERLELLHVGHPVRNTSLLIGFALVMSMVGYFFAELLQSGTYTLYRNSVTANGASMRLHVATFDASDGSEYNRGNCEIAKSLFQNQDGVKTKYWCEKGQFKK
jgi:hypothetical protein